MIRLRAEEQSGSPTLRRWGGASALLALAVAAFAVAGARGQVSTPQSAREAEKFERQRELEILRSDLDRRKAAETRLKTELDTVTKDRKKFSQALVDTAARMKAIEQRLSAAEARLKPLDAREAAIRRSLDSRRAILAEVLAAVARLSRQPAPAIALRPEDALTSVRSAMLLGAVVPELRSEAETLVTDLTELARVRQELVTERNTLADNRADLEEERIRLAALVQERQRRQNEGEKALDAERAHSQALAKQVENVSELVARIEKEIESAARAAEAARKQAEATATVATLFDPARINPAMPFVQAKGRLPLPVAGTRLRDYGASDGGGGVQKGIQIATRAGAQVTAPCDGWVVYAGLFRSYGRLLIINAGGGYHVLLAGMEQINVELGQFVLTGEPVAAMGSGPKVASAAAVTTSQPVLYIEFRKDGNSIDPTPWWAETVSEKARG
ncbi:MAG: peptidoglycan DD-metalloendopeptidase family protein [Xanthobacteraceae bacterium]